MAYPLNTDANDRDVGVGNEVEGGDVEEDGGSSGRGLG